jgi:hypothetical protein
MKQIEIYQTKDKQTEIEVRFEEDNVWLTRQQKVQLFKIATVKEFLTTEK